MGERDLVRGSSNIVQGSHNTVDSYEGKVYGNNNIAIGESTEIGTSSQTISNGVAVGYNSSVTADGGIALGSGSVASTASGAVGYDPTTRTASTKPMPPGNPPRVPFLSAVVPMLPVRLSAWQLVQTIRMRSTWPS